jgi:hypothetical protein
VTGVPGWAVPVREGERERGREGERESVAANRC